MLPRILALTSEFLYRTFTPCDPSGTCDWVESSTQFLQEARWYATNQLLPEGQQIIIGGRRAFNYEFLPFSSLGLVNFTLLAATNDPEEDNLYPFVHLLPDGTLFIFANRDSIVLDYNTNTVLKTLPTIPGEPRNYPSAGSSVLLPLLSANQFLTAEILVCGGAQYGAYLNPSQQLLCSSTCGRIMVTDAAPVWSMETMPINRCMGDMIILPSQDILIINGAQQGKSSVWFLPFTLQFCIFLLLQWWFLEFCECQVLWLYLLQFLSSTLNCVLCLVSRITRMGRCFQPCLHPCVI